MTAAMFETHKIVNRLKDASDALAEAVTDTLRETRDADFSQLATKQDLQLLEQRIATELGGTMVVAVGAVAALVRLL